MEHLTIACPSCGHHVELRDARVGSRPRCPRCQALLSAQPGRPEMPSNRSESAASRNLVACPDCGNRVSRSASACPRCGRPSRPVSAVGRAMTVLKVILAIPLVILIALVGNSWYQFFADSRPDPVVTPRVVTTAPAKADPDRIATLELPGGTGVWLATTDADWDDLLDAENRGAEGGPGAGELISRMATEGRARKYPNGTRVRVLKSAPLSRFVEIIEGEDRGRSGWVQYEFVR